MKAGFSFDTALERACLSTNGWELHEKRDQKLNQVLNFCKINGSLSFRALQFFRETEKLQQKLHNKQENVSLQAKAQATVSVFLYLVIFLAQYFWNEDFKSIFAVTDGRVVIVFSVLLLFIGVVLVFRIARTDELEV